MREMLNHGDNKDISCDGGGGPLGHPKVFLAAKGGLAKCPYCGNEFKQNIKTDNTAQSPRKPKAKE